MRDFGSVVSPRAEVLALHGFANSGLAFREIAGLLGRDGIRLVAPDQLGFGRSDKPERIYSLDLYTRLTLGLADSLDLERPFLLGHSAGGKVAATTIALYPERFQGLILVNSGGFSVVAPLLRLADTPLFHIIDLPFFRNRILKAFQVSRAVERPEQWEAFRRIRGNNTALDVDAAGYRESIRKISVPTLVIWGLKDRMLPRGTAKRVLRDIPHADFEPLPDSGHTPMRDEPERFAELVSAFIGRHH